MCVRHLIDAFGHIDVCIDKVELQSAQFAQIVTALTLPVEQEHVFEAGFFSALNTIEHPLTHILSKVINIRCQARKFATVTLKETTKSHPLRHQLRTLFVCSLLGNYPHSTSSMGGVSRSLFYGLLNNPQSLKVTIPTLFSELVENCSLLIVNCLRDFLIYSIEYEPALAKRLEQLMNLTQFRSIVNEHMARVRGYFDRMVPLHTSALSVYLSTGNKAFAKLLFDDINKLLSGAHTAILKISYRRPNLDIHHFLMSMRKTAPLVASVPAVSAAPLAIVEANPDFKAPLPPLANAEEMDELESVSGFVSPEQFTALREVMLRIDSLKHGALMRLTDWLHWFGVPDTVITFIRMQISCYYDPDISTEQLKLKFASLQRNHPHAYNLLQVASEIIKETQKHHITVELPIHLALNQLEAAKSRVSIQGFPNSVLKTALQFVYCSVCRMIYSLLRDFNGVYKTSYKLGLRDASVNYITDEVFCNQNRVNTRGSCSAQPLRQLNLLGKVMFFKKKLVMLCPQQGCCSPMAMDSSQCDFNERGIACKDCTESFRDNPPEYRDLCQKYEPVTWKDETQPHRSCDVCTKKMENVNDYHVFPFDVVLCHEHSGSRVIRLVQRIHTQPEMNKAKLIECITKQAVFNTQFKDKHARSFKS